MEEKYSEDEATWTPKPEPSARGAEITCVLRVLREQMANELSPRLSQGCSGLKRLGPRESHRVRSAWRCIMTESSLAETLWRLTLLTTLRVYI